MKKNILTIAILALGFTFANGQTGNVGINTTNPTNTLHIKGTFRLEDTNASGKILTSDANGVGSWQPAPTSSGGTVTNFSAGDLTPLFTTMEATPTTTPALNFALTNAAAGTVFGNNTASAGQPSYFSTNNIPVAGNVTGTLGATTVSSIPATADKSDWKLAGNSGTMAPAALGSASTNFVGTTDNQGLALATNNKTNAILGTDGSLKGGGNTLNSIQWGTLSGTAIAAGVASGGLTGVGATGTNSVALGKDNSATSNSVIALGDSNIANYGVAIGKFNLISAGVTNQQAFAFGYSNQITSGGGYAVGANNSVIQGFAFGAGNTVNSNGIAIGQNNTANGAGAVSIGYGATSSSIENVYGNSYHLFYNSGNTTTTRVGVNVANTAATADLTVKATIKMMPATLGTCDATTVGTMMYQEVSNSGTFYGCRRTGANSFTWQAL